MRILMKALFFTRKWTARMCGVRK